MDRFRFHRPDLQAMLKRLYETMGIPFVEEDNGSLSCEDKYAYLVDDLQSAARTSVFPCMLAQEILDCLGSYVSGGDEVRGAKQGKYFVTYSSTRRIANNGSC